MKSDHNLFWGEFCSGKWEPETIEVLTRLLGPGKKFIDIGAWIGVTSIIGAAAGASVVAFEPDPVARRDFVQNLGVNADLAPKVKVRPEALSVVSGVASISSSKLGDSKSSLERRETDGTEVRTLGVDHWLSCDEYWTADLVKIDVEGAEYFLVSALAASIKKFRPTLLLSVHGYVIRERLSYLPPLLSAPIARLLLSFYRLRLLRALRPYKFRYEYLPATKRWTTLEGRVLFRFLFSLRDTELLFRDEIFG